MMEVHQRRCIDEQLTYQYHKLERAIALVSAVDRACAIDIGAHVGLWSMQLAKHFEYVWAFEPNPVVADLWRWNVLVPNARLEEVALGKAATHVGLRLYDGHSGHTQVYGPGDVRMCTLDSYGIPSAGLIKIDVEGHEAAVVKGAEATIRRCRPVIVVEQKGEDGRLGLKRDGARHWLEQLGMRVADCIGGDYFMVWP